MYDVKIKKITIIALFIALIVVASKIEIRISDFRFHLGNAMCLLAAFILKPLSAGFAAGLGSMMFDMLFYTSGLGCLVTFATKFVMSFVASFAYREIKKKSVENDNLCLALSGAFGEIAYIILYMLKTYIERKYVLNMAGEAIIPIMWVKFSASLLNALVAIIVSITIYHIVKRIKLDDF